MKTLTVYEARDGSRWDTADKASDHEALLDAIADAMAPLGPECQHPGFSGGEGYIQHTSEAFHRAYLAILNLAKRDQAWWFRDHPEQFSGDRMPAYNFLGRIISDNNSPLNGPWNRLSCVDDQFREWGQMYYADHPSAAEIPHEVGSPEWTAAVERLKAKS